MTIGKEKGRHQDVSPVHSAWPADWRARIGIIVPSSDISSIPEQQSMLPDGVLLLATRGLLPNSTPEGQNRFAKDAYYAAELLATAKPDVIAYNCIGSAVMMGAEYEANLIKKIEEVSGAKACSAASSVIKALETLKIKKVVLVVPNVKEVMDAEADYLESFGLKVVYRENLGMNDPMKYAARPPWENYTFALNASRKAPADAEAIVFYCGALRTAEITEALEKATGKIVLSANLCNVWMFLKLAGIREPIYGYGSLLSRER